MKDKKTYRENIIQAIRTLIICQNNIFLEGINVLMSKELKDIDDVFEVGDTYDFTIKHLENSTDKNVLLIVEAIHKIRRTVESLEDLNDIDPEETHSK